MAEARRLLARARRPLVYAGGGVALRVTGPRPPENLFAQLEKLVDVEWVAPTFEQAETGPVRQAVAEAV